VTHFNQERWSKVWCEATSFPPPTGSYDRLAACYAEPTRHYHNATHISDCLSEFDGARALAVDPLAVEIAIWFHDVVYQAGAADNEERSAELASGWLRQAAASRRLVDAVQRLILSTRSHEIGLHTDAPLIVDVDLSVLGSNPGRFWEYEA
jgi:predicted metal-dependent HD superfamily phosphohydrolase